MSVITTLPVKVAVQTVQRALHPFGLRFFTGELHTQCNNHYSVHILTVSRNKN